MPWHLHSQHFKTSSPFWDPLDTETYGRLPWQFCNFSCEITKLPWQSAVRVSAKMATKFLNVLTGLLSEDVRPWKKALEILNTKNPSRRILISANSNDAAVSLTIFYLPPRVSQSHDIILKWDVTLLNCDHIETTTQTRWILTLKKRLLFYWQVDKVDVKPERKIQFKDLNYMRREMY